MKKVFLAIGIWVFFPACMAQKDSTFYMVLAEKSVLSFSKPLSLSFSNSSSDSISINFSLAFFPDSIRNQNTLKPLDTALIYLQLQNESGTLIRDQRVKIPLRNKSSWLGEKESDKSVRFNLVTDNVFHKTFLKQGTYKLKVMSDLEKNAGISGVYGIKMGLLGN